MHFKKGSSVKVLPPSALAAGPACRCQEETSVHLLRSPQTCLCRARVFMVPFAPAQWFLVVREHLGTWRLEHLDKISASAHHWLFGQFISLKEKKYKFVGGHQIVKFELHGHQVLNWLDFFLKYSSSLVFSFVIKVKIQQVGAGHLKLIPTLFEEGDLRAHTPGSYY